MKKGKIIVIESGINPIGQGTQMKLLKEKLESEGKVVKTLFFSPAWSPTKMYLSGYFHGKPEGVNSYASSTFFSIDRFETFKIEWERFYSEGGIILTDKYTTSTMIDQGVKIFDKEEREKYLNWLFDFEFNKMGLPKPNCVIFLDILPIITRKFMTDKEKNENTQEYVEKCYTNSLEIANKYNWDKVNCCKEEDLKNSKEIHEEIYKKVKKYL